MTRKEIGAALVKGRKALKLTPYKVCKDARVATQQLRNMENATTNYTIDSLSAVCKVLKLEIVVK